MAIIDSSTLIANTLIADAATADKAMKFLPVAIRQARDVLLSTRYDEIEKETDSAAKSALVMAVSLLTLAAFMPHANLRLTEKGGFVYSTGFDASKQSFLSTNQIAAYIKMFEQQAFSLLDPYASKSLITERYPMVRTLQ